MIASHPFFGRRLAITGIIVSVVFSLLLLRLWYLQGVKGSYFRDLSENNRTRTIRTLAARGTMYDREGRVLVQNRPSFQISMILEDVPNKAESIQKIAEISGRPVEELEKQLGIQRGRYHFEPKVVISDAKWEEMAKIRANAHRLPGVIVDVVPTRFYPEYTIGAQLFGFSREVSKAQIDSSSEYKRGDVAGQTGLEKIWERELRGRNGYRQVEVDATGRRRGDLGIPDELPGLPGGDLELTIDLDLQRIAEKSLEGRKGAVVVLDPRNGEVLALASAPGFDANIFAGQVRSDDWQRLSTDKRDPLHNRAIQEVYPPGSTFKIVTTVAALAEKKATAETTFNCPGYYFFAGRRYHCHKRTGHGSVTMRRALTVSCNAFYFQLGQLLGIELIERYSKALGLGAKTGIDLPGEVNGIVPSESWKKKVYGEKWYPGDTLPVSIGQGYLVASPIQLATMMATVANGGTVYQPHVVRKVFDRVQKTERLIEPKVVRHTELPKEVWQLTREIAAGVVQDPQGTGKATRFKSITVGGKTGTAQVGALGKESLGEQFKDHAWFVSFAPVENPELAMAVLVENSGHGGTFSAPIARKLYESYFGKRGRLAPEDLTPQEEVKEATVVRETPGIAPVEEFVEDPMSD